MKTKFSFVVLILVLGLIPSGCKTQKENHLLGNWKLVTAKTNHLPNPEMMMDRTFMFNKDGTFEGRVYMDGQDMPYNAGKYFLPNDSTIITLHYSRNGKLSPLAYTYNFHVQNDSLHFYGIYFSPAVDRSNLIQMNYIDEWWVKPSIMKGK